MTSPSKPVHRALLEVDFDEQFYVNTSLTEATIEAGLLEAASVTA